VVKADAPTTARGGAAAAPPGAWTADLPWPPWPTNSARGGGGAERLRACVADEREREREREVMGRRRGEKVLRPQGVGSRVLLRPWGQPGNCPARTGTSEVSALKDQPPGPLSSYPMALIHGPAQFPCPHVSGRNVAGDGKEIGLRPVCCATTMRRGVKAGGVPVSVRSRGWGARRAGRRPCTGGVLVRAWWVAWDFPGRGPAARIPALPGPGLSPGGAVEDGRAARSPPPASTATKPNPGGGGRPRALPSR